MSHDHGGVSTNALARSIQALTFGSVKSYDTLTRRLAREGLGELDQQFQLPIAGSVGPSAAWSTVTVKFATVLIEAIDERHSPYADPLFTYGAVISSGDACMVSCSVRRWLTDGVFYTGADLDVGVVRPGAVAATPFKGEIHLNFQGYGTPDTDEEDGDEQ